MSRPAGAGERGRALRIGITGPIGCGKTQVARWLGELGAVVVDADVLARDVTAPGQPAHDAVVRHFGPAVTAPDGSLDRGALARIVFADAARLRELEAIVHPAVRPPILAAIEAAERAGAPAVAIEAIKLVEGGLAALCGEVWLVICDPAVQRERLLARGMDAPGAERRMAAQAGLADRLRPAATLVLDTGGSMADTRAAVAASLAEAIERHR